MHKQKNAMKISRKTAGRLLREKKFLFVLGFAVVGTSFLVLSKAATPSVSIEAENAGLANGAIAITDTNASGSQAVKFSSASTMTGWPSQSNTGYQHTGVTLTPYTGSYTLRSPGDDGKVIDSKLLNDRLVIYAKNVTIKRSKSVVNNLTTAHPNEDSANIYVPYDDPTAGQGLIVEDTELTSSYDHNTNLWPSHAMYTNIVAWSGASITVRRCHFHGSTRALNAGTPTLFQDNYIFLDVDTSVKIDPGTASNAIDSHAEVILSSNGTNHINMDHNWMEIAPPSYASSVVSLYDQAPGPRTPNNHITYNNNMFAGRGSYVLYGGGLNQDTYMTVTNNYFSRKYWQPGQQGISGLYGDYAGWNSSSPTNIWSGNKYYDPYPTGNWPGYVNVNNTTVPVP